MTQLTADIVDRRKASEDRRLSERLGRKTTIQSAREKLTSTTGLDRAFEFETLRLFAQGKSTSCIMLAIYTVLIATGLLVWVPAIIAIIWSAIAISAMVLGTLVSQRFMSQPDEEGTTALMEAASLGLVPIVQLLLGKGADLEARNKAGQNAWLMAAMSQQVDVIEIFKKQRDKR